MTHPDEAEDIKMIQPLVNAVEALLEWKETIDGRLSALEKSVFDDLFGGIQSLYKTNAREQSLGAMREKHGPAFEPHAEAFGKMSGGSDFFEKMQDLKDSVAGSEGYSDEAFDEQIEGAIGKLAELIADLRGQGKDKEADQVQAVSDSIEGGEAKPEAMTVVDIKSTKKLDEDDLDKELNRMKKNPAFRNM